MRNLRLTVAYDGSGYPTVRVTDMRSSFSGRMAFYGLYISGEYLLREQLDSMSRRPVWATGWYGQTGWHLPLGFEPVFRMGEASVDEREADRCNQLLEGHVHAQLSQIRAGVLCHARRLL